MNIYTCTTHSPGEVSGSLGSIALMVLVQCTVKHISLTQ